MPSPRATKVPRPVPSAIAICILGYVILFSYAIARPSIESLFLGTYGKKALPEVWIAVAVAMAATVAGYNYLARRRDLLQLMVGAVVFAGGVLAVLEGMRAFAVPGAVFLLYVWKDVYIVVLLEILWSFANLIFNVRTARWLYGLICVFGSLGGISGGLAVGAFAKDIGTARVPWLILPVLLVVAGLGLLVARLVGVPEPPGDETAQGGKLGSGMRVLRDSPYLIWMVALVGLVQIVVTLIDYQYNSVVQATFPDTDVRTAVIGKVYASVDASSLTLQLLTGPLLKLLGIPITLLSVPFLVGSAISAFLAFPRFAVMAVAKVASKAFDYSLFKAAKEILYIPLSYAEKTRGKAIVDMLTYRTAKGGASLLLLALIYFQLTSTVLLYTLALIGGWIAVTVVITRRWRRLSATRAAEATEPATT